MERLVRRYIRTTKLCGGTWDSPITMAIASQVACQFVHTITVAGTSEGGYFGVKGSITSGNLTLKGVHARATILTAKDIGTGNVFGIHVEVEALGTGKTTGFFEGIDVETYVESDASVGDHYGIYVKTYSDIASPGVIMPLRLEHNGASVAEAFIGVFAQTGKMSYFLESSNTSEDWCNVTQTASGAGGWLKVKLGGYDRYIALFTTVS